MTQSRTVLVLGATGNVGRHVVSQLLAAGVQVRAVTRHPETVVPRAGLEVVAGDLTGLDGSGDWDAALDDVPSMFLIWPLLSAELAPALLTVAKRHVHRVVYLSSMSVDDRREPEANGFWGAVEHAIEKSGLEWTFLRAGGFASNTLGWADQIRADGIVRWPYGRAGRSLVHERDLADVAVRALLEDGHVGEKYVLTGPEAISQIDQVHAIGEAIGRRLRWEELSPDQARRQLLAAWGDPAFVDGALGYWATLIDAPEPVSDAVEKVTGVPARTFREWAEDHREDFR